MRHQILALSTLDFAMPFCLMLHQLTFVITLMSLAASKLPGVGLTSEMP